jgi:hypothetical protein
MKNSKYYYESLGNSDPIKFSLGLMGGGLPLRVLSLVPDV